MYEPNLYGNNLFGEPIRPDTRGIIADKFLVPPFSVFNGREGFWQDRKRAWISIGIKSEAGRGENVSTTTVCATDWMKRGTDEGGSIFDPVLCEIAYRWFVCVGGANNRPVCRRICERNSGQCFRIQILGL